MSFIIRVLFGQYLWLNYIRYPRPPITILPINTSALTNIICTPAERNPLYCRGGWDSGRKVKNSVSLCLQPSSIRCIVKEESSLFQRGIFHSNSFPKVPEEMLATCFPAEAHTHLERENPWRSNTFSVIS